MPLFVILQHSPGPASRQDLHWDFMLETGDVLRTWALADEPAAGRTIPAEALADHRKEYLDYEGPVSGGRGVVSCWDRGTCEVVRNSDAEWVVRLVGVRLRGQATLSRQTADGQRWRFDFTVGASSTEA